MQLQRLKFSCAAIVALIVAGVSGCSVHDASDRGASIGGNAGARDRLFNDGWRFTWGDATGAEAPDFADAGWWSVKLPHDWSIEGVFDQKWASATAFLPGGIGWYRKTFETPADASGKSVAIHFDGIYKQSKVWCNGHLLGERPNGYVPLDYDLTPYLKPAGQKNVIAVRVDHSEFADSRWYPGSGIYRNVFLRVTDPVHVAADGTYVTTPQVSAAASQVMFSTTIENDGNTDADIVVNNFIEDGAGHTVGHLELPRKIAAGSENVVVGNLSIAHPALWSADTPALYELETRVIKNGREVDRYRTRFGIREVKFDPAHGLFVNGISTKMKGVCLHEDAGALGSAIPVEVWERRLRLLKEAGCNAIRTSHNPPAPEFLDLCDRMGFLVMDEAFDEWTKGKKKWVDAWNGSRFSLDGYETAFDQWADRDLQAMVRRDRNHPSIILWSIGNEIDYPNDPYPLNSPELLPVAQRLVKDVKALDTTRPVTAACAAIRSNLFFPALDVVGYNYQEQLYAQDHAEHPERVIYGSENKHTVQAWEAVEKNDFVAGQFLWTGIDYLGESRGWPSRGNSSGILDLAGFPKPNYYFRQSLWTAKPMVYLDLTSGGRGQRPGIVCYTNCQSVELIADGKSVGEQKLPPERVLRWPTMDRVTTLRAIGKNDGKVVCEFNWKKPGDAKKLVLHVDATRMNPTPARHVAQVEVDVADIAGNRVTTAAQEICITFDGSARLLGIESGDQTSHEDYQGNFRHARNGRLLVYVETDGTVTIHATADGLEAGEVKAGK